MLKDIDIRKTLLRELEIRNKQYEHRIIEELAVCDGEARVDIAVANGKLCGYEIKSDADTLERLGTQQKCYDKTFDKITIVVGEKFEDKIDNYVPDYWGIYIVSEKSEGNEIRKRRSAKINKKVEARALLELLWKEEIIELLKEAGIKGISGKNRRLLRDMVIENISKKEIADYTRETLKYRQNWRE